jgi:2-polyprenyl-3-methyl-5-hydroxy-6-metoxy-1,4-benzoquinol methylase
MASLKPSINQIEAHQPLDEIARESGLRAIRNSNFKKLLSKISALTQAKNKLLDVGCAHGWFLELAQKQFDVLGIEPDQAIFDQASKLGLPMRLGYFPAVLNSTEKFDVIVFNDVIEHIPDIQSAVKACHHHLSPDGLLVLNLPNSNGTFYRLSKIFTYLSFSGFFDRMWQVGMPSPHVHYFNQQNLGSLLNDQGFKIRESGRLDTLSFAGLYTRLAYAQKKSNPLVTIPLYFTICLGIPVLKILPADITYTIAQR